MSLYQIQEPDDAGRTQALSLDNEIAVGIDLGTTNSVVSAFINGKTQTINSNELNSDIIPSIVDYSSKTPIIGKITNPEKAVISAKRFIASHTKVPLFDISPVEVSAEILKYLKKIAADSTKKEVKSAVITVPAYFDDAARQATKDAAAIAGLKVLRLINEPTAAAIAYGLDNAREGIYAVYDLGGGTFDVTILSMQMGVFEVLATNGNTALGGDDFDDCILDIIAEKYSVSKASITSTANKLAAKAIKKHLSSHDKFIGNFPNLSREISIEKSEFISRATPLIQSTFKSFKKAMIDADVNVSDIEEIILVGGSTRMPLISQLLEQNFNKKPLSTIDPDRIVSIGAAVQAHALTSGSNNLLLDVNPLSIGIEVADGLVDKMIFRNSTIPCKHSQLFTTQADNQTGFKIHVIQGESDKVKECRSLAQFELKNIPPLPKGEAKLELSFTIDADGILSVGAVELTTGQKQHVEVKPSYGLDREDILRLIENSL